MGNQSGQQAHPPQSKLPYNKCFGCAHDQQENHECQCPAWGQTCRKCNRQNHYEIVCMMLPTKRRQGNAHSVGNELNQHDRGSSLTSISMTPSSQNISNMVPNKW